MLDYIIDQQNDKPGIDITRLKPGTKLRIKTLYSVYEMETTEEPGVVLVSGGTHISGTQRAQFNGSTWGGSAIKCGWIGYEMHMEFLLGRKRRLTTSCVQGAAVEGDGWHYDLEW